MQQGIRVENIDRVIGNLNRQISEIRGVTQKGLVKAALFIIGESNRVAPRDTSNMVHSSYILWKDGSAHTNPSGVTVDTSRLHPKHIPYQKSKLAERTAAIKQKPELYVELGYLAMYAIYVHEQLEWEHKGGKQAKFLQNALHRNFQTIKRIVKEEVKKAL